MMTAANDSFIEYARIVLKIIKVTGFSSFSVDKDYKESLKLIDCFFVTISFMFGLFIIGDSFQNLDLSVDDNFIVNFGNIFAAYTAIFTALITMLFFTLSYRTIWNLIKTFHEIDLKARNFYEGRVK
jgi:hypothetical protein